MDGLVEAAREVYAAPASGFVAARDAAARRARGEGDRDLARAVAALRKPSAAASVVNALVREEPDDVAALLAVGQRLLAAQAARSGADLRALDREQRATMADVVARARERSAQAGQPAGPAVAEKVEATLRAAMTDPEAARAVLTGLLVRELESSGFGPVDVAGSVAVEDAPPLPGAPAVAGGGAGSPDAGAAGGEEPTVTLPGGRATGRPPAPRAGGAGDRSARVTAGRASTASRRDATADAEAAPRRPTRGAAAGPGPEASSGGERREARRRSEAREAAEVAERETAEAAAALEAARERADEATARAAELAAELEEVTARIEELTRRQDELRTEQRTAAADARRARGAATSAEKVAAGTQRRAAAARSAAQDGDDDEAPRRR